MDREQEQLGSFGFFGILRESLRLIFSWKKIFSQITVSLVLPLSFIFLANSLISQLIFHHDIPSSSLESRSLSFWLFDMAYFIIVLLLSLLATAAVVYTIACIYTSKDTNFKKVTSVVPKVWKRLLITFFFCFAIICVYHIFAIVILVVWFMYLRSTIIGIIFGTVLLILYVIGFGYIGVVWNLASVMSVLEDVKGIQAIRKSKNLIKGKIAVSIVLFVLLGICFGGIEVVFEIFVEYGSLYPNLGIRFGFGMLCLVLLVILVLLGLVIQTVTYFVCKSYHHENIDKSSLADHLEVIYLGQHKDVQLQRLPV